MLREQEVTCPAWSAPVPVLRTPPGWLSVALDAGETHWVLRSECSGEERSGLIDSTSPPPTPRLRCLVVGSQGGPLETRVCLLLGGWMLGECWADHRGVRRQ